jgi:hypothetical protein
VLRCGNLEGAIVSPGRAVCLLAALGRPQLRQLGECSIGFAIKSVHLDVIAGIRGGSPTERRFSASDATCRHALLVVISRSNGQNGGGLKLCP